MKAYRFRMLLIALLCFTGFYGNAQTWNWVSHNNLAPRDFLDVVTDQNGYIYASGTDSLGFVLTKYKPDGVMIWSKTDTGTVVRKLFIDAAGNLYISAYSNSWGGSFIFTARLDSAGNRLWTKGIFTNPAPADGSTGFLFTAAADSAGNTYMSGNFTSQSGIAQFDTIPLTTLAADNYFLAKYNNAGKIQWLRFLNNPVYSIGCGPQDSYFLECGTYFQKYDANGTLIWQQSFTGNFNPSIPMGPSNKLKSDAQGNLYVVGNKLAKYNSNGTLAWAKTNQSMPFTSNDFYLTNTGNIVITGTFSGSATFGNGVPNLTSNGTDGNLFVAQFSGVDGSADWAKQASSPNSVSGEAIVSLPNGSYIVAGNFKTSSAFDQHAVTGKGFFVAKLAAGTLGISDYKSASGFRLYPNPATSEITLTGNAKSGTIEIYNATGRQVFKDKIAAATSINVAKWPAGMYLVRISSEDKTETRKLVISH